ncbi:hypothetical protein WDU94_000092 [Cyamophila willieti]
MSELKQDQVYTDGLKALQKRMELMYNNKEHSDTVFIIKKHKFYVSRQLIGVASKKLDAIIKENFTYHNKHITLHAVKCEESFSVILKYMYGLDMNFGELKMEVLCRVIQLAETYQLEQFSKDLQCYLSKHDQFNIDSLAVLLNTARKFNLEELYKKLKVFAFQHAEDFVKHESIVHVSYEVLTDLVKSDYFFVPEIDILKAVLNWHVKINTKEETCIDENQDMTSDADSVVSDISTASTNMKPIENKTEEEYQDIEQEEIDEKDEDNILKTEAEISEQKLKCSELMKLFSENVLKSLLAHIRGNEISWLDIGALRKTILFDKYKHVLDDTELFSQTNDTRRKYDPVACQSSNEDGTVTKAVTDLVATDGPSNVTLELNDIRKMFILIKPGNYYTGIFKANESHRIADLKWTVRADVRYVLKNNDYDYYVKMYLECTSDQQSDWECTTECQVSLISHNMFKYPNEVLPFQILKFSKDESRQCLGELYWDCYWFDSLFKYRNNQWQCDCEVVFKSISVNKK